MAGLRIPIQFLEKAKAPVFEEFSPVFFICFIFIFEKESLGVT